ncbi:hypothetical protein DW079_04390 [Segatella copri]|uniref:Bacteroidetes PKD-like domain-containing protein n=1 Tax=Segatella copri TaxID=165179 RepID=A0A3R6FA63_9BACT|nr:hypothetical protein DW079_04390 [Segatella copri]
MKKIMNQYMGKVLKSWMMLFAISFALAGTATLSSCSSDDDPFFTVSEDDNPRILNTDLADKTLDRKTKLNLEIKVTPVHYTTVTWLLDGTQIAEGNTIDQTLPVGNHELKIVATTTKGKSTSRTLKVTVTPAADDPALGTNAVELWVAPGAETTIHKCKNLGTVTKVMVGGKEVAFEVLEEGTALKLTAPTGLENGDYDITLVDGEGNQFSGGIIKVTTEPRPSMENTLWEGHHYVSWDLGDGDPNKNFNLITKDQVAKWKEGQILRVYCSMKDDDAYHQIKLATDWWTDLTSPYEFGEGNVMKFELTQDALDKMAAENGFICVGHGYYVDKVTIE